MQTYASQQTKSFGRFRLLILNTHSGGEIHLSEINLGSERHLLLSLSRTRSAHGVFWRSYRRTSGSNGLGWFGSGALCVGLTLCTLYLMASAAFTLPPSGQ